MRNSKFNGANNCRFYNFFFMDSSIWKELKYRVQSLLTSCDVTIVYIKSFPYYGYIAMAVIHPVSIKLVFIRGMKNVRYVLFIIENSEIYHILTLKGVSFRKEKALIKIISQFGCICFIEFVYSSCIMGFSHHTIMSYWFPLLKLH